MDAGSPNSRLDQVKKIIFLISVKYPPMSEVSREVANSNERKNLHTLIYRQSPIFSSVAKKLF